MRRIGIVPATIAVGPQPDQIRSEASHCPYRPRRSSLKAAPTVRYRADNVIQVGARTAPGQEIPSIGSALGDATSSRPRPGIGPADVGARTFGDRLSQP